MANKMHYLHHPHVHFVLPLVYDDALSYYEQLHKLLHKINEVIEFFNNEIEQIEQDASDTIQQFIEGAREEINQIVEEYFVQYGDELLEQAKEYAREYSDALLEEAKQYTRDYGEGMVADAKEYADDLYERLKAYSDAEDQRLKDYFNALISNRLFLYTTTLAYDAEWKWHKSEKKLVYKGALSWIDSSDIHALWTFPYALRQISLDLHNFDFVTYEYYFGIDFNETEPGYTSPNHKAIKLIAVRHDELIDFNRYRPIFRITNTFDVDFFYAHQSNPLTNFAVV